MFLLLHSPTHLNGEGDKFMFHGFLTRIWYGSSKFPVALFTASIHNLPIVVVDMPRTHAHRQVQDKDSWDSKIMKAKYKRSPLGDRTRRLNKRGPDSCLMLCIAIHCQTRAHPRTPIYSRSLLLAHCRTCSHLWPTCCYTSLVINQRVAQTCRAKVHVVAFSVGRFWWRHTKDQPLSIIKQYSRSHLYD